jgi:RND superfamily putative drug exporter
MFREWGAFVTRHPYAVLAVWLIMLVISVPLALTFSDRLTYSMDSFIPKDLESIQAQDIYDARFPDAAQSQIIVAVKGDPGTAVAFVDRLNRTVNDGSLPNITATSYMYDIQRETLANVSPDLHSGLHELYDSAYDASRELYNATDEMANASRDLFDLRDNVTMINRQLSDAWGQAAGSSNMMYDLRAQIVMARAGMYQINNSNPNWTVDQVISAFMANQGLTSPEDRAKMTAIYALGPAPSEAAVDALTRSFVTAGMSSADAKNASALYAMGNNRDRIWEYVKDNALAGQTNGTVIELIQDAWSLGRSATNETFDKYVLDRAGRDMNESERKLITEVYDLGRDPSDDRLQDYTVNKINEDLGLKGNMSYLYALLSLDGNATKPQVESFAREWATTHDLSNPGILPEAVVEQMDKGDLTLYIVGLKEAEDSPAAEEAVVTARDEVKALLQQPEFTGMKAFVTGAAAMSLDAKTTSLQDMENIDKISVVLILVLLCLYFRSVVTPLVPLLATGTGIVICFGALHLLTFAMPLFYLILTLCVVIMLGAGTDYCVFMLSRYAEERALGREVKESVITSVEHAGKSVASSGLTAMIGFSALLLVDQGIFGGIGVGIALGVLVSLFVALTLLPAALTLAGDRLFWPRKLFNSGTQGVVSDGWAKITRAVLRRSKVILVLALLVSIPAVYLTLQLQLGNDYVANMAPGVESKQGFDAINDAFGSGTVDKVMVLMTLQHDARDASGNITDTTLDQVEGVSAMLAQVKGVEKVYSMTRPDGETINYENLSSYPMIEREYYRTSMDDSLGNDDRTIALYTSFRGSPYSVENSLVIDHIRSNLTAYADESGTGETFMIGGSPAGLHDYQSLVTGKYNIVYLFVLIGVFFVLMVLLRSVFTPIRLIMTLLASVVWTIAAYVVVFQIWGGMSTEWLLPIFLFCALMGLGVDYDIFLVSRIREEVLKGKSDEEAIEHAVKATGTIITLCGAVMASAFGSMMISSSLELKEFGFVLFLAIILDATLMRLVIVPAIMVLMKKYNWWMPFAGQKGQKVLVSSIIKKK